jgi:hypothetical protein
MGYTQWKTKFKNLAIFTFFFSLTFGNRNPQIKIISFLNSEFFEFRFLEEFRH